MTTATRPARIDRDHTMLPDGGGEGVALWLETYYPSMSRVVRTFSYDETDARTTIMDASRPDWAGGILRWVRDYDPTRVTVGGLAEAHEAVCARVERGDVP